MLHEEFQAANRSIKDLGRQLEDLKHTNERLLSHENYAIMFIYGIIKRDLLNEIAVE